MNLFCEKTELTAKILSGVSKVSAAVASTMGPCGKTVILCKKDSRPATTKDGYTVVNFFKLDDPIEDIAVQILREATSKTNKECGDGTSTTTVLTNALLQAAHKFIVSGVQPNELIDGLNKAGALLIEEIQKKSRDLQSLEDIEHVASISANDKDIGKLIAEAIDRVGQDGSISIETSSSRTDVSVEYIEGFKFEAGYASSHFVTDNKRGIVEYNEPLILITDHKISTVAEMMPVLQQIATEKRPLIIVADEIEEQALAALVYNTMRPAGALKIAAIRAPLFGSEKRDLLEDLAIKVGGKFVSKKTGFELKDVKLADLGIAKKIEITRGTTTIVGGYGSLDAVNERIELLQNFIQETENLTEAEYFQQRITRLISSVAIIKVGGHTESEALEKRYRVEDALEAVKSAKDEGILPGGGCALLKAGKLLKTETSFGAKILLEAIRQPIKAVFDNAAEPLETLTKIQDAEDFEWGYNVATKTFSNLVEDGVLDSTKVVRNAILNSISAASVLITTNYCIVRD